MKKSIAITWLGVALAAALWFIMFSPFTAPHVNFWCCMTASALTLTAFATMFCREWVNDIHFNWKQIAFGLLIAFVLWWVFWIGDKLSQLLFSFARPEVDLIYGMKSGTPSWVIALLLLLVIGPAEEIFWRGFVQRRMSQRFSPNVGFVIAVACYTLVHVCSLNFMLVMAAMVAGLAWGLVYRLFPQSLTALVVSHALWDAFAFVILPF